MNRVQPRGIGESHVPRHADDFEIRVIRLKWQNQLKMLLDWILSGPEAPCCGFADDRDVSARHLIGFAPSEVAASNHGNSHRVEICVGSDTRQSSISPAIYDDRRRGRTKQGRRTKRRAPDLAQVDQFIM